MATTTTTPLMNLILPVVGSQIGPTWASNLNAALENVDAHDHTSGKGSKIPTAGLNINSELNFNENGATSLNYSQYKDNVSPLSAVTYPRSLDVSGGELYYNDAAGNQIQLTNAGGINLTSIGTIGGDYSTSTASLAYSSLSTTFTFASSSGIYSKVNLGDLKIFERISGGKYVEFKTPTGLSSDYSLTLPTGLPASTLPLKMSATGALSTGLIQSSELGSLSITESQLATNSVSNTKIVDSSVTTSKISNSNVTYGKLVATNSNSSNTFSTSAIYSLADVSGSSFSFTITGRAGGSESRLLIMIQPATAVGSSYIEVTAGTGSTLGGLIYLNVDGATLCTHTIGLSPISLGIYQVPPTSVQFTTSLNAGTKTFKVRAESTGTGYIKFINCCLRIVEL